MKRSLPLVLMLVMLMSTACQKGAPTRAVQAPHDAPPEIITVDFGINQHDVFEPVIDQLITAFEKRHTQYRIRKVYLPEFGADQRAMLNQRLKAGELDILPAGSVDPVMLEPLDAYLDRSGPAMARVAGAASSLRFSGRLYEVPILLVPEAFVINRELWEATGLPLPAPGWTWQDLREAAAKLTHGEGASRVWGLNTVQHESLLAVYLMEKTGKSFWLAKEEDLREALHYFTGLVQTDRSMPAPPPRDWGGAGVTTLGGALINKKGAIIEYTGIVAVPQMNQWLRFAWDVVPVPAGPGQKPIMFVRPHSWALAAGSAEKDAAWEFIRFATGPDGAAVAAGAGVIPTDGAAVTEEAWSDLPVAPPAGMRTLFETPWVTSSDSFEGSAARAVMELYRLTNLCLRGELDPDSAVDQFVAFRKRWIVTN